MTCISSSMPLKANGCHSHLKLKIKASSVIFAFLDVIFSENFGRFNKKTYIYYRRHHDTHSSRADAYLCGFGN